MTAQTSTDTTPDCKIGPAHPYSAGQVDVSALSHRGTSYDNEDHFFVRDSAGRWTLLRPPAGRAGIQRVNYVMVVADGQRGGHAGESRAASIGALIWPRRAGWFPESTERHAREIEQQARSRVRRWAPCWSSVPGAIRRVTRHGTTLTTLKSLGRDLVITHVGDSRAYCSAPGTCIGSRDHTYAQLLVDTGQLATSISPTRPIVVSRRAWRIECGCRSRHRSATARRRRSGPALQRRLDGSLGRRGAHQHPARVARVERCV